MINFKNNKLNYITLMAFFFWTEPSHFAQPEEFGLQSVQSALVAMGGGDTFWREGSLVIRSNTKLNYTARDQGLRADEPHWTEGTETLAFDFATERAILEYWQIRADGSIRWRREDYVIPGELMIVNMTGRRAIQIRGDQFNQERLGISRRLPQFLLKEVLENSEKIRNIKKNRIGKASETVVHYCPPDQPCLQIVIDDSLKRLVKVSSNIDYPSRGDTRVEWRYSNFQNYEGIGTVPTILEQFIGDDLYFRSQITDVQSNGLSEEPFVLPDDIKPPEVVYPVPESPTDWDTTIGEVSPGIFHAQNVRPGINAFFADMGDFILVFDAPAGYPIIELIPPGQLVPRATSSSISLRLLNLIQNTIPGKPVRFVVISHHHSDHIGGLRAFMKNETQIYLPRGNLALSKRIAGNPHSISNENFKPKEQSFVALEIENVREITGTRRKAIIIPINDAPHASDMLTVWFPDERVLFTGDLFYPQPLDRFPEPDRVPIMKFFVEWLDKEGLSPVAILGSHGTGLGGIEHLEKIRNFEKK